MPKNLIVIFIWVFTVLSLACNNSTTKQTDEKMRKIADKTDLSGSWTEILPVPPLEATDKIFIVGLQIEDVKGWADEENTTIAFNDGTTVKIEIELINEAGEKTLLYPNGIGKLVEFGKRAQNKENVDDGYFQKGEKFGRIRLKSSTPVTADKIIWTKFEF